MRGTQLRREAGKVVDRFIPAHAGNTERLLERVGRRPVHPRACGEHLRSRYSDWDNCGSSPRMRGTRLDRATRGLQKRFIPAHAGNTPILLQKSMMMTVHPRACGEHWDASKAGHSTAGSSPRMRGTPSISAGVETLRRFIPAHAGNT